VLCVKHSRKHLEGLRRMETALEAILIKEERIARILTKWTRISPRVGLELASLQQESPEPEQTTAAIKEAKACLKILAREASRIATAAAPVNRRQRTADQIATTQTAINVLLQPLLTGAVQLE